MKVKTSELSGAALDWAVAKCEEPRGRDNAAIWLRDYLIGFSTRYSTTWSQGGPIIEREEITVSLNNGKTLNAPKWVAYKLKNLFLDEYEHEYQYGPSPLIAAMRCYVASKQGEEIEIPDELNNAV